MPGSIAESQHGRRGGGWLPKGHDPAATPPPPPPVPRETGPVLCPVCRATAAGHDQGPCWEGRARMARARQAALADHGHTGTVNGAGILAPLDHVDLEALRRHP